MDLSQHKPMCPITLLPDASKGVCVRPLKEL